MIKLFILVLSIPPLLLATEPKKIARFTPSHIVAFRAHNNVASIDELKDLNQQSNDVLGIYAKFSELEIKGNELVTLSHDYTSACTTKIVWHTQDTFKRAKEYSDQCVAQNLDDKSTLELNMKQKNCIYNVLHDADHEIDSVRQLLESCKK